MARSWSSTTCSASTTATPPASSSATPTCARRWSRASRRSPRTCARGATQRPSTATRSRPTSWTVCTSSCAKCEANPSREASASEHRTLRVVRGLGRRARPLHEGEVQKMRRFLPSPAMVVAVVALAVSLGGSAYAALVITGKNIKNGTVTGKDIRSHSLRGSDVKHDGIGGGSIKESTRGTVPGAFLAGGSSRFAVVNSNGQAVRGRDISSAARTEEGRYQVIFNANVRNCGYYATIGGISASTPPSHSEISVS